MATLTGIDPISTFRKSARFRRKLPAISALTAFSRKSGFCTNRAELRSSSVRIYPKLAASASCEAISEDVKQGRRDPCIIDHRLIWHVEKPSITPAVTPRVFDDDVAAAFARRGVGQNGRQVGVVDKSNCTDPMSAIEILTRIDLPQ
jgi:hypothetical protein